MRWSEMNPYPGRQPPAARCRIRTKNSPLLLSYSTSDVLAHYGISGQQWGVRRFQNEDGTYTEEGKLRYNKNPESSEWKKKEAGYLSDEELNRRNSRKGAETIPERSAEESADFAGARACGHRRKKAHWKRCFPYRAYGFEEGCFDPGCRNHQQYSQEIPEYSGSDCAY